jgi:excisionase family DNA binding protein
MDGLTTVSPLAITMPIPVELIEQIAARTAELVLGRIGEFVTPTSPWLDLEGAIAYTGFGRDKLYKLTAAQAIPFRKKEDGQGLLFHRDELDAWLKTCYPRQDRLA